MARCGAPQLPGGSESRPRRLVRSLPGLLAHLLALSFTSFLMLLSRPGTSLFSWHPFFMALAFCLCLTEAILLLSPENSPFCFCSRNTKVRLHWIGQSFVILFAAAGLVFIISSKNRSEQQHFTSWHSILGAITIAATCGQALCGVFLLFPKLVNISGVARLKLYHITCGLVVYLFATLTVLLGVCSDWFQAQIKGVLWYICLLLPLFPALIIMNQILNVYLPKKKLEI
ncbi:putative transmembrane reductase CYB561D1 [Microcaecilia unicolor]|uniref:ascorbate ferrireductase (transmembrane) n=1 Tax=Microcaecilia unicolor TaxID=1415580 RepID=A0A6P7ZUV5_9AMPH|nr:cytochrome b561 domain-containing protein 1 [Microcaecilia unicolor]